MNGLFEWALREIGFDVVRLSGAVRRDERGDDAFGTHLVLAVKLDQLWFVDVGFSDGMIEPVPLQQQVFCQQGFRFRLEQRPDRSWRFYNHEHGACKSFDFFLEPADEQLFHEKCHWLSTSSDSLFSKEPFVFIYTKNGYEILTGRKIKQVTNKGFKEWRIQSESEYKHHLKTVFSLEVSNISKLWEKSNQISNNKSFD